MGERFLSSLGPTLAMGSMTSASIRVVLSYISCHVEAMGSCSSCAERDEIQDDHPTLYKVKNVDDDGNELESGVMEITELEIILHTRKRDTVRWPYSSLRRYGYDSNLFSFESGRRCQTGQGIFAFKCTRAEEMFNVLQDNMHCSRINVHEEPSRDRLHTRVETDVPSSGLGHPFSIVSVFPRRLSYEENSSHPSSRHASVGSARLPSVGEESTHPLIVPEKQVHTYVNTSNVQDELTSRPAVLAYPVTEDGEHLLDDVQIRCSEETEQPCINEFSAEVQLEPQSVKFVLGPTPAQKREREKRRRYEQENRILSASLMGKNSRGAQLVYENLNGLVPPLQACPPCCSAPDESNCMVAVSSRALQNYENWPALPPVWEEPVLPKPVLYNGLHTSLELDMSGNTDDNSSKTLHDNGLLENNADFLEKCDDPPTVFSFELKRCRLPVAANGNGGGSRTIASALNYIQIELEEGGSSESEGMPPRTPRTPVTPLPPQTPTRHNELYATIDLEKTAAMSSLQRALPRDDGTVRKTRHNSTDPPM
uniref:fibroblast growth factor receptor substrate 2-like isoform X2 n=1 Tax=Myxine glutinosa TaxID=7769 RepID=UPI00358FE90C